MKVLITGGAGYIGSHANRYFAQMGVDTVVLDDLSSGHREAVVAGRLVTGDFGDPALLRELFAEERFDAVIHFAAYADVADSVADPGKYYRNNVSSMITLLDQVVESGVKYFVFSSSAAVFGEPECIPIDEEHPRRPINPYGETKLIGEYLLRDYEKAYGLHYCALRYFNAAGASGDGFLGESHQPEHHLIPLIQAAIMTNSGFNIYGTDYPTKDGTCLRDFVHVEDLARAHYLGLRHIVEHKCSEVFNLGSGGGFTVKEVIEEFERLSGKTLACKLAPRRAGDPAALLASIDKAKSLLGWTPEISSLSQILRDAWNWENKRRY